MLILGEIMDSTMEVTGAMVSTMGGIGAMETTTTTSQVNVQDIMEGKGEAQNCYPAVEELLETMEVGSMEVKDSIQDTTMAAAFGIVSVLDLLSAAIFTMDINVHSHSTMGNIN